MTFHRSNAWECVAEEVRAVRERVGMTEISNYAKYRVTGEGAGAWLSSLLTQRMPAPGRITLTGMLNDAGRIVGEFTVARPGEAEEYLLFGSLPGRGPPLALVPPPPAPRRQRAFQVLGLGLVGLSVTGPVVARRADGRRAGPRPVDRGVPVHDLPQGRPGHDAGVARPDQLLGRARVRDLAGARAPADAVRPDRRRGRAARPAAVRDAGADEPPAREELRDVVPRVPPDLHDPRGRSPAVREARPRVRRPGGVRGAARRRRRRGGS